jgi:MFS family permease
VHEPDVRHEAEAPSRWLNGGVAGIGTASFFSDLGHEIPTSLLPSLVTTSLGAPAAALGIVEGVADGLAGLARVGGGALSDDPSRRRAIAVGGYTTTALLSALIGGARTVWQVGALRAGAWAARGLRVPARNALLADVVPSAAYGRAYGFERAMDNFGAIAGPLLAVVLVGWFGTRTAIRLSVIPGLLAALAILYAVRRTPRAERRPRQPVRLRVRPVLAGPLGRVMAGATAFELGNCAATLLILRATQLLDGSRPHDRAIQLGLLLYVGYNTAAALASVPAGRLGDRRNPLAPLAIGVAAFAVAYLGFAKAGDDVLLLGAAFAVAGVAIGFVETAEHAVVAAMAPPEIRGSAFGVLAGIQSFGNVAASGLAGLIWSAVSPSLAFLYLAGWMAVSLGILLATPRPPPGLPAPPPPESPPPPRRRVVPL